MANLELSRLESRFSGAPRDRLAAAWLGARARKGEAAAEPCGVTFTFETPTGTQELRIALEEREKKSPDALTGMEAQNRFTGPETVETKIFGRLSAWQNWIFQRPNAAGPEGALPATNRPGRPHTTGVSVTCPSAEATSQGTGASSIDLTHGDRT